MLKERIVVLNTEFSSVNEIYEIAKKVHEEKPFDAAHDWEHHLAVCLNGLEIIKKERLENEIDIPIFLAASLFHDLERGSKSHDLALKRLAEGGFSEEFTQKVVNLINQHSFDDRQESIAANVLWAADKIEYVSKDRFVHSLANLSKVKALFYKKLWRDRIEKVSIKISTLGLSSAQEMFWRKFKELKEYVENEEPSYKDWFKGLSFE